MLPTKRISPVEFGGEVPEVGFDEFQVLVTDLKASGLNAQDYGGGCESPERGWGVMDGSICSLL